MVAFSRVSGVYWRKQFFLDVLKKKQNFKKKKVLSKSKFRGKKEVKLSWIGGEHYQIGGEISLRVVEMSWEGEEKR